MLGSPTRMLCSKPGSAKPPCGLHFISDGLSAITSASPECAGTAKTRKTVEALTARIALNRMIPLYSCSVRRLLCRRAPPRIYHSRRGRDLRHVAALRWDTLERYSITSSARASSVGGTVRPSTLAVIRLTTRSNLVGCSTGRSAGFAPRRILST